MKHVDKCVVFGLANCGMDNQSGIIRHCRLKRSIRHLRSPAQRGLAAASAAPFFMQTLHAPVLATPSRTVCFCLRQAALNFTAPDLSVYNSNAKSPVIPQHLGPVFASGWCQAVIRLMVLAGDIR
ncbi:MAG: hypothetical protein AABZ67_16065 [Pseudomonadota bacterium]